MAPPFLRKSGIDNQTLKKHLTKLVLEIKCLPLALLRTQTAPRKNIRVLLHEMLFLLPHLEGSGKMPTLKTKYKFL